VARPRGSFRGRQSSPRRKVGWEQGPGKTTAQAAISTSSSVIVDAALSVLLDGLTLVRTRGQLLLRLTSATSEGNGFQGAFGIGVATTAAVVAGAASVPTPITEQAWDGWLYWTPIILRSVGVMDGTAANDADSINAVSAVQRIDVDSKAMRKLKADDSIYAILEVTEGGTANLAWEFDSRMLFKLP